MSKQRISYVPLEKMDARMRAEMERCQREGTPRPESSAIRAHVTACFWFFADSWHNIFRTGVLDHAIKELCRLYVSRLHHDTVFLLRDIVTLANIVERVKFHHQMVHAIAWPLSNGQAVMSAIDVHEIQRHRRTHEVGYLEPQHVPIECKGRVDFRHYQHRMSHALRPGTKASYMPCRAERFIGDLTTVKSLNTAAGRIAKGNYFSGTTLVRHGRGFPPHRDAGPFQARRQCIERRRVRDFPAKKTVPIRKPAIDNQALLSVVHAERTHLAAAINRLKPKLADS